MVAGGGGDANLGQTNANKQRGSRGSGRLQDQDLDYDVMCAHDAKERLVLQLGEVVFGNLYHTRSLMLANKAHIPWSFILSSNAAQVAGGTGRDELKFSLSSTSLKQFNMVKVDASSRLPIYLHFHPVPRPDEISQRSGNCIGKNSSSAVTNAGNGSNDPIMVADNLNRKNHGKMVWERELEIYVTCRLVKDFQRTIFLQARCRFKQLDIHVNSVTNGNSGGGSSNGTSNGDNRSSEGVTGGLLGGYGTSQSLLFVGKEATPEGSSGDSASSTGGGMVGTAAVRKIQDEGSSAVIKVKGGKQGHHTFVLEAAGEGWQRVLVRNVHPAEENISIAVRNPSMFFQVQCMNDCECAGKSECDYCKSNSSSNGERSSSVRNNNTSRNNGDGTEVSVSARSGQHKNNRQEQLRQHNREDEVCVFTVVPGRSLVILVRPNLALLTEKQVRISDCKLFFNRWLNLCCFAV
jgi:hypothetical protein